jgi:hypothetical protein
MAYDDDAGFESWEPDAEHYPDFYDQNDVAGFDMFDRIPGTEYLDYDEYHEAFDLFYAGFVESGGDREAFFDYMNMSDRDFPWEDWREWMGYE